MLKFEEDEQYLYTIETKGINNLLYNAEKKLTNNCLDAEKITEKLKFNNSNFYNELYLLLFFEITGQNLVTFYNKICNSNNQMFSATLEVLKDTTKINNELVFTYNDIKENLYSPSPQTFLDESVYVEVAMSNQAENIRMEIINYYIQLKKLYLSKINNTKKEQK